MKRETKLSANTENNYFVNRRLLGRIIDDFIIKTIFSPLHDFGHKTGKYISMNLNYDQGGDSVPNQRYPMMDVENDFIFDRETDNFLLENSKNPSKVAETMMKDHLRVYEFILPKLRRGFAKEVMGYETNASENLAALLQLSREYAKNVRRSRKNETMFGAKLTYVRLDGNSIRIKEGYEKLEDHLKELRKIGQHFVIINSPMGGIWPIDMMEKGTDFTFVDQATTNMLQGAIHAAFHLKEGITGGGQQGINANVVEVWAKPIWQYIRQALMTRTGNRYRTSESPHQLKMSDYMVLRAWSGQAIVIDELTSTALNKRKIFHGSLGLVSPTMNLATSLIPEDVRNNVMIDSLFKGDVEILIEVVDKYLGEGAFKDIFSNRHVINRMAMILERAKKMNIDHKELFQKMFPEKNELNPTLIDRKTVALVWLSPKIKNDPDLVTDLVEIMHNERISANDNQITPDEWISWLISKGHKKQAKLVKEEYKNAQQLLKLL